jgi:hypothetical protein
VADALRAVRAAAGWDSPAWDDLAAETRQNAAWNALAGAR